MCKCTFFLLFFLGPKTARCLALLSAPLVSYKYVYCMCIFAIVNNLAFFFSVPGMFSHREPGSSPARGHDCVCRTGREGSQTPALSSSRACL